MSLQLIKEFNVAKQAIYDHVGFEEDWVVYPLDDCTREFWDTDGEVLRYADSLDEFEREAGNYYEEEVYKQRYYGKWVYEGESFTMIFANPGVDGMKWLRLFDNAKRIKEPETII